MSFLGKTFGKIAAGTMVAGFMLAGGVGAANASEVAPPPPPPVTVEAPEQLPPPEYDDGDVVAPAPKDNTPGKSGDHRSSTPQSALDNNQSHKQDEKKAEKAEKKAAKGK